MLANSSLLEGEPRPGAVAVLRRARRRGTIPCLRVPRLHRIRPGPAGFVSKSNSYKAWIGSEEAKQTKEASEASVYAARAW